MSQPIHWPGFLRQLHALEQSWNTYKVVYPREDAVHFLPLPIPQFIAMLTDAVMAAPLHWDGTLQGGQVRGGTAAVKFIDVGCGTGTKARLAQALFGLDVFGIDIVPAFVAEAEQSGVPAARIDAFEFNSYGAFDIVFANRPSTLQDELEKLICDRMAPEAVLMAANWRTPPPGFEAIAVEYERPVCGVFRKPAPTTAPPQPSRSAPSQPTDSPGQAAGPMMRTPGHGPAS